LSSNESKLSLSSAGAAILDPFGIGGRLYQMASLFLHWRVRRMRLRYIPVCTQSGVIENAAGTVAGGTAVVADRGFAWCVSNDPAFGTPSFANLVGFGGAVGNTSRGSVVVAPRDNRWYFTSTTVSTPGAIDTRMATPYELYFQFDSTSSTANVQYGYIVIDATVEFRGPVFYSNPVGAPFASNLNVSPLRKGDSSLVDVKNPDDDDLERKSSSSSPVNVSPLGREPLVQIASCMDTLVDSMRSSSAVPPLAMAMNGFMVPDPVLFKRKTASAVQQKK